MNSPQTLRRGKALFSTRATFHPASDRSLAAVDPAGPAPITRTSWMVCMGRGTSRRKTMGEGKSRKFEQFPFQTGGKICRQLVIAKSGTHARQRIMACHGVAADGPNESAGNEGRRATARFTGSKSPGFTFRSGEQEVQLLRRKVVKKQVCNDCVGRGNARIRQKLENI